MQVIGILQKVLKYEDHSWFVFCIAHDYSSLSLHNVFATAFFFDYCVAILGLIYLLYYIIKLLICLQSNGKRVPPNGKRVPPNGKRVPPKRHPFIQMLIIVFSNCVVFLPTTVLDFREFHCHPQTGC